MRTLKIPFNVSPPGARRRFERAPVFSRLSELTLPHLDTYPDDPGAWLSEGPPPQAWPRLRSLRLTDYMLRPELLGRLSDFPFWTNLRAISILLPITYVMPPVPAILMLAGIFYGSQYGGAIGAILLNLPSHPPEFRQQALRDLRAAQKAGALAAGGIDLQVMAKDAGSFAPLKARSRVGQSASGAIGQLPLPVKLCTWLVRMLFRLATDGVNELQPPEALTEYEPGLTEKL